jgi:DNA-binding transcriptional LysR family regulator
MQIIEIDAFLTVARLGNFTRAAERLHLSQPAMSRRIDQLEQELAAPLFERFHGGARLTAAGHAFLPFAEQALAALRDGAEAVRAVDQEDRGTVALGLVGTLASTDLPGLLQRFRAAYPQIRLVLHTGRSDEISAMVRRGEVDLGLRYFADSQAEIVSERVHEEPLRVVASSHTRRASTDVREPGELAGVPWVLFPTASENHSESYAHLVQRQLHLGGLVDLEVVKIDSLTAQKRLIEADFGLGLLPESSIQEELRLDTLQTLAVPALYTTVPVMVIRRRQGYLGQAARRLLAEIVNPPQ